MAKLNLIAPAMKNTFFAGVEGQYTSRRRAVGGNGRGGFLVANLPLSPREFARRLQLSGSVFNMFGKRYAILALRASVQGIRQDGATFALTSSTVSSNRVKRLKPTSDGGRNCKSKIDNCCGLLTLCAIWRSNSD